MSRKVRTSKDVKAEFQRCGISVASWARKHRLPEQTVRDLLSGKAKGHRGIAHRAAVLLGLKDGVIDAANDVAAGQTAARAA